MIWRKVRASLLPVVLSEEDPLLGCRQHQSSRKHRPLLCPLCPAAQKRLRDLKSKISSQSKKNFVLERGTFIVASAWAQPSRSTRALSCFACTAKLPHQSADASLLLLPADLQMCDTSTLGLRC